MDRFVVAGTKKLLSLVRTKIRLAVEAGTVYCRPKPLPLVKMFTGVDVETIDDALMCRDRLSSTVDYSDPVSVASTVFSCMDLVEGVKYMYEPSRYVCNLSAEFYCWLESEASRRKEAVNLLIMSNSNQAGLSLYVGENPPEGVFFLSGVPTSLASFLAYAFVSEYFSGGVLRLRNVNSFLGRRTLIADAIHHSLGVFGAACFEG